MIKNPLSSQELQAAHELGEAIVHFLKTMTVQPEETPQPTPTPIPQQGPSTEPEKELLSVLEAARMMNVSERTLTRMSHPQGTIQTVRMGSRVLYPRRMLMHWITENANR
jgi:excisionase family DNA binding protein